MNSKSAASTIEAAAGVVGAVLLVYGIGQWTRPGAYVTAGLLLLAVALWPGAKPKGAK
jgi:hypothetical protein